jgi:glucosyl-3-phosphoglycerate synthase
MSAQPTAGASGATAGADPWASRTWHAGDLPSIDELLAAKAQQTVSIVLPALNEEPTVGAIVGALRAAWTGDVALVDEIVVLDSGSTDGTAEAAALAGAQVVHRDAVMASVPAVNGKGEAMWRSLFATTGDLVVFIDADLVDIDPAMVPALLAPLLLDPTIELVKGFGDRPVRSSAAVDPVGGGRVTELVARPLLAAHWPELSGLIQPLIGEYAARRRLLEQLPFVCGYGVELAMLIDTMRLRGAQVIAQAEIGPRQHRHQPLDALGRMAAELWQVALDRLERDDHIVVVREPHDTLTQFESRGAGVTAVEHRVVVRQRPPAAGIIDAED